MSLTVPQCSFTLPLELGGIRVEFATWDDMLEYYKELLDDDMRTEAKYHLIDAISRTIAWQVVKGRDAA